jgi:hypothetical protein
MQPSHLRGHRADPAAHESRRRCRGRSAFTLIELVLVLALMVVIVGLTWPLLTRPLAYQQLRHAADQIVAEWTNGRVEAMRTGDHQIFSYKEDDEGRIVYTFQGDPRPEAEWPKLPEGVVVDGGIKADDAREMFEEEGGGSGGEMQIWFYADGTCSEVPELILRNEYGMRIRLSLRGLTGVAYIDEDVPDDAPDAGPGRPTP